MGLSATIGDDQSMKRRQLTELLGDVVYTYGVEKAQRDGIIPDFDWTVHPTRLTRTNKTNGTRQLTGSPANSNDSNTQTRRPTYYKISQFRSSNLRTSATSSAHTKPLAAHSPTTQSLTSGKTLRRPFTPGADSPPITTENR